MAHELSGEDRALPDEYTPAAVPSAAGSAQACFERARLRQAAQNREGFAEPFFNLAEAHRARNEWDLADECYRRAVRLKPSMAEAWNNLGNMLRERRDPQGAVECYRQVVRLLPDRAEAHYNLGSAQRDAGELDAAAHNLQKALRMRPGYAEAWNNLGLVHKSQQDYSQAIDCFSKALILKPDLSEAHWNRSFAYLVLGRLPEGFRDYEWRFRVSHWRKVYPFRHHLPPWDGSADSAFRILVHDEQGLGDTLQFIRYLPMVAERCGQLILETQPPLVRLLQGLPGIDRVVERPSDQPQALEADCQVPLMSLPLVFGTRLDSIPAVVPYLWPDLALAACWAERLRGPEFKIGIAWAGRPEHQNDRNRSCRLERFLPLSRIPGVRLFSLQKGPALSQIAETSSNDSVVNLDRELKDFSDTAAMVSQMDLVISVDTSVAHLAGAMARRVWVLLPAAPDWRWLLNRETSPWYPTMRLFRQPREGDWGPVFREIEIALRVLRANRPPSQRP